LNCRIGLRNLYFRLAGARARSGCADGVLDALDVCSRHLVKRHPDLDGRAIRPEFEARNGSTTVSSSMCNECLFEANLDAWLQGPGKFVRGTKMIYSVPDEKDRQDVIAYLKTLPK
jgi:hypothetical protein